MAEIHIGDSVRWNVDVDKVYSASTKVYVGKAGVVVEPKNRASISKYNGNSPGCFDVDFEASNPSHAPYVVWNIPYYHLEKVIE